LEIKFNKTFDSYKALFENLAALKFHDDEHWRSNLELADTEFVMDDKTKR